MQLLSEFLDLGPWAVAHCLTVGIFPYIVRLFHSPVPEVKPHLVFIWGKIIASAQTEFGRNDSVRDFGYKYFITCLSDTENLSPLTRTITAFALAKMLEKDQSGEPDAFFQDVYLKQNFLPIVLTQLFDNTPKHHQEMHIRMRLWLILALAKLWCKNDEARWFGIRHNVPEVLLAYLNDVSPEVRAATVYALGTLIENQTTDPSKQDHADQISHEIGGQLVKITSRDASPLVRCLLVEAFRGLVKQFEAQLCAIGIQYIQEIKVRQSQLQQNCAKLSTFPASPCPIKRPMRHSTINLITPPGGGTVSVGINNSLQLSHQMESTVFSQASQSFKRSTSRENNPLAVKSQSYYRGHLNLQRPSSPILHKLSTSPGSVFFTGSGNTPSTNIYVQFWLTLVQLAQDPYPEISRLATILIQHLYAKIREKTEYQANHISPNIKNVVGNNSSSTPDISSQVLGSDSHVAAAINVSSCAPINPHVQSKSSGVNHVPVMNGTADRVGAKELSSNSTTYLTSSLKTSTATTTGATLIHSAQFPGRRHQQTDQRLRVSVTNLPNTILNKNPIMPSSLNCDNNDNTSDDNSNTSPSSNLSDVRTQFFSWSCRWFTRPLLSTYGQLSAHHGSGHDNYIINKFKNNESLTNHSILDNELVSLGTVSVDPDAVAYTDRVNRLRRQRKLSRLGRIKWERFAGEVCCPTTPMANMTRSVSTDHNTNNTSSSRISLRSNDSGGSSSTSNSSTIVTLHPSALYNCTAATTTSPSNISSGYSNIEFDGISTKIKFHPYQPYLVVVNPKKGVAIHSSKNLDRLHCINLSDSSNPLFPEISSPLSSVDGYSRAGYVTDVDFINAAEEQSLLLTATNDGYIRVWRNYTHHLGQDPEILTAWAGITDLHQTDYPIGVVVHWNQQANQLSVSGDTRTIRIWDCYCESRLRDLNTGADTSVTCLTQSGDNHLIAAGFNDGGVRVWDLRVPSSHNNDNLIFNSQADSDRIHKVMFSPLNRLYAIGAMGGVGVWQLSSSAGSNNITMTTSTTTSTPTATCVRSNYGRTRCISTAVTSPPHFTNAMGIRSDSYNSGNSNATTSRRFRRLPCPPRLSLPANSFVSCADLLVDLSSPHAHLAVAGYRGQSSISLHRIQDGSLHSSIKHYGHLSREQFGTPTCCTFHPNELLIAAGLDDGSLLLLNVQHGPSNK
ncbi:unnamed protein product [Trichobilharzia szidati]|nr:unnamed protein product [Trichobilharzia szidati]